MTGILVASMAEHKTPFGHNFGKRTVEALASVVEDPNAILAGTQMKTRTSTHGCDLDILSATTYPTAPMTSRQTHGVLVGAHVRSSFSGVAGKKGPEQIYGGLLLDTNRTKTVTNPVAEEEPTTKRKARRRKRASDDDDDLDDSSKHKRGRPRLDTQDETAADRRRTQIRLAQRAHRNRKENTISELKQRVLEMEGTIEEMNAVFLQLHDSFLESSIILANTALAKQLSTTADHFAHLVQNSITGDSDRYAELANLAKSRESEEVAEASATSASHSTYGALTTPWGYRTSYELADGSTGEERQRQVDDVLPDIDRIEDTRLDQPWNVVTETGSTDSMVRRIQTALSDTAIDPGRVRAEIERPLKTNGRYTYSFQETTFARRLHRLCLEHGYRILTTSEASPGCVGRTFKFTFCFSNRGRVLRRFQELLQRKAGESLENWDLPFVRIGGAGTHFPRRDAFGNAVFPPNTITASSLFEPRKLINVDTPRPEKDFEGMLENLGYGGEWFDAHDVEQYLRTKGLYLDGHSSFADVDPTLISLPALTDAGSASSALTSAAGTPDTFFGMQTVGTSRMSDDQIALHGYPAVQDKVSAYTNMNATLDAYSWLQEMSSERQAMSEGFNVISEESDAYQSTPKLVTIDVNKFLARMVQDGGICLGRAPGFRKDQVDIALALSLQEAF